MLCALLALAVRAQVPMRQLFASVPDSLLPLVTKNNRLDCIDFIENNMEAKVRNRIDEYVTLEQLTPTYMRFRTSQRSVVEMRSLTWQPTDSTSQQVVAFVQTVEGGQDSLTVRSSHIAFYSAQWQPLPIAFQQPALTAFLTGSLADSTLTEAAQQARRSLEYFHPVCLHLSPEAETLVCTLQTADLSRDERRAAAHLARPVTLRWNGRSFVSQ